MVISAGAHATGAWSAIAIAAIAACDRPPAAAPIELAIPTAPPDAALDAAPDAAPGAPPDAASSPDMGTADHLAPPPAPPPRTPRAPLTWNDLVVADRSSAKCSRDAECVVETEIPQCACCPLPNVFAIHLRDRKPPPPQPPCTPACAADDLPCRAPPPGKATDLFRARCKGTCVLERK